LGEIGGSMDLLSTSLYVVLAMFLGMCLLGMVDALIQYLSLHWKGVMTLFFIVVLIILLVLATLSLRKGNLI
jgi:hypothetical protein